MFHRRTAFTVFIILFSTILLSPAGSEAAAQGTAPPGAPRTAALLSAKTQPVTVICFGDSVTGVYYHTGSRRAYTDMLELALERVYPGADVRAVNAGISGNTTVDALARMDADVLAHKPQLVTVMFGLNDMTRVPLDTYKANLVTIIQRCRAIDAEVLLCTPNAVYDTERRPTTKLVEYCAAIREVAAAEKVPVVDCYQVYDDIRAKDAWQFALIMSDEIHPNMRGHKLFAEEIARVATGQSVSLADVTYPVPALPKLPALLAAGETIDVCAMPPYDQAIVEALKKLEPAAVVNVRPWPVEGKTLTEIEASAKEVREMKVDLVVVAVPAAADADTDEQYLRSYTWIMNYALSFSYQEWDCFVVLPSVAQSLSEPRQQQREALALQIVKGQDLGFVERQPGDATPAVDLLTQWFAQQNGAAKEVK